MEAGITGVLNELPYVGESKKCVGCGTEEVGGGGSGKEAGKESST